MRVSNQVHCDDFPCETVNQASFAVPAVELSPEHVSVVLISEAAPAALQDNYYMGSEALFNTTTLAAFASAGLEVASATELLERGIYCTNAVKCAKIGYTVPTAAINTCSLLLEQELALFSNVRAFLLMGDVAIKAVIAIARRNGWPRPIPAGSTYKIRSGTFSYRGMRVIPSYLQAGPSFFIERTKRKVIAEDIARAVGLVKG